MVFSYFIDISVVFDLPHLTEIGFGFTRAVIKFSVCKRFCITSSCYGIKKLRQSVTVPQGTNSLL